MSNPRKGAHVPELGQSIAGPFFGIPPADPGAEVTKVERRRKAIPSAQTPPIPQESLI